MNLQGVMHAQSTEGKKGSAAWWKFFQPVLDEGPETQKQVIILLCKLCNAKLSSSNPGRIAQTHIKLAACKAIKSDTTLGEEVAALFHKDNPADANDADNEKALQDFQERVSRCQ
ncbi:hypothetical protein WJX77_012134 [Trebouxia sp. C0004]